jgi:hypothetical protein
MNIIRREKPDTEEKERKKQGYSRKHQPSRTRPDDADVQDSVAIDLRQGLVLLSHCECRQGENALGRRGYLGHRRSRGLSIARSLPLSSFAALLFLLLWGQ